MLENWTCPFETCLFEVGPAAKLRLLLQNGTVSQLGCWAIGLVLLRLGLRPSFILIRKSGLFLDLGVGALNLMF